jgi:hypothetical protein
MSLPPRLATELERVKPTQAFEVTEDQDIINVVFKNFEFGGNFNFTRGDVLIRIPRSYPDGGPDMFWTDPEVKLADGRIPQSAEQIETYCGRPWRRFSWHKQNWQPSVDSLDSYLEFVRRRLRENK